MEHPEKIVALMNFAEELSQGDAVGALDVLCDAAAFMTVVAQMPVSEPVRRTEEAFEKAFATLGARTDKLS